MATMLFTLPLLLLLLSACSTRAVVHRIGVTHQRLPSGDGAHEMPSGMATDIATKEPLNETDYSYALVGNISLGSPAQEFTVKFDFDSPNLYVLDKDAQYYNSYSNPTNTDVTDKQTYDPSVTNSLLVVSANFSSTYDFMNGSVVSDVLQMADGLEVAVEFEDTSLVRSYMKYYSYDGVFGLSSIPDANASTTLLDQLQYSLDSPVYTLSLDSCPGSDKDCTGQLELGGLASDICQGDSWTALTAPADTSSPSVPTTPSFNITSVSTTTVGDSSGCSQRISIPMTVFIDAIYYSSISTSYQVHELCVQASNASYNPSTRHYELTSDQMALAQPVQLNLASGGVLRLYPEDYTSTDAKGKQRLNVYAWYNAHERSNPKITLGRSFLSRHCLSKNFHTGVWSITDRVSSE